MKTLDELIAKVDAIAESQGKLLAALNDQEAKLGLIIEAIPNRFNAIELLINALDGRLKVLGDGLADEIRQARNFLNLEIPHCVNGYTGRQVDVLSRELHAKRRPAKPKRKRTK